MDKSWRVILAFVGIFFAGTVSGGLITLRVVQAMGQKPGPRSTAQGNPAPQGFNPQLMHRMAEQLDLTREQRDKIKPIEARTAEELRRLRRENLHTTELVIERMQDDIAAVLTPEQKAKFDELILKARERVRKYIQDQEGQRAKRRDAGATEKPREVPVPRD